MVEEIRELAASPQKMAEGWHTQGKLAPLIREMLADGQLSWDDIDPPPQS